MSVKIIGSTTKYSGWLTFYTGKADYGAAWASLTLPTPDQAVAVALYENTNVGGGAGIRRYTYANGAWSYSAQTAV